MAPKLNVRTDTACKIVRLDVSVLNDVLARKLYSCAPRTTPGTLRVFDEAAMLPLYFFARLLDWNIKAPWAAGVACEMAEHVAACEAKGTIDNIVMLIGERNPVAFGGSHPTLVEWMSEVEYERKHKGKNHYFEDTIGFEIARLTFDIKKVREIIADMMQHEIKQFLAGKSGPL